MLPIKSIFYRILVYAYIFGKLSVLRETSLKKFFVIRPPYAFSIHNSASRYLHRRIVNRGKACNITVTIRVARTEIY